MQPERWHEWSASITRDASKRKTRERPFWRAVRRRPGTLRAEVESLIAIRAATREESSTGQRLEACRRSTG